MKTCLPGTVARRPLVLLASLFLILGGCSKDDNNPVAPPVENTAYLTTQYGTFPLAGTRSVKGILASINTYAGNVYVISSIGLFFGPTQDQSVYGGMMFLNNNLMDTISSFGSVIYSRPNSHIPAPLDNVAFDGSYHHWVITGSAGVAAFTDSVASPGGPIVITSPQEDDEIPLNSNLEISWTPSSTDSVLVMVTDTEGHSQYTIVGGSGATITSAQLGKLTTGVGRLDVFRYRVHPVPASQGSILLVAMSTDERDITLLVPEPGN